MESLNLYEFIIEYGVIGLGVLFALFACILVSKAQHRKGSETKPRIFKSIYFFIGLSLSLCSIGFFVEKFRARETSNELLMRLQGLADERDTMQKNISNAEKEAQEFKNDRMLVTLSLQQAQSQLEILQEDQCYLEKNLQSFWEANEKLTENILECSRKQNLLKGEQTHFKGNLETVIKEKTQLENKYEELKTAYSQLEEESGFFRNEKESLYQHLGSIRAERNRLISEVQDLEAVVEFGQGR